MVSALSGQRYPGRYGEQIGFRPDSIQNYILIIMSKPFSDKYRWYSSNLKKNHHNYSKFTSIIDIFYTRFNHKEYTGLLDGLCNLHTFFQRSTGPFQKQLAILYSFNFTTLAPKTICNNFCSL